MSVNQAEKIVESLREWTWVNQQRRRGGYLVTDDQLAEEFYDLFGYGGLTTEIVGYLFALLQLEEEQWVKLFERLQDFYLDWWEGKFMDAPPTENWPQKKLGQLKEQGIFRGLRQVDIYTGLNVLILLFNLHSYGQEREELKGKISFHPCGQPDSKEIETDRLKLIINYGEGAELLAFTQFVAFHLSNANLSNANLIKANLNQANLNQADLNQADLNQADLSNADLIKVDLIKADLNQANLINADLNQANLSQVNLCEANLINADLNQANLCEANLINANLIQANLCEANLINANLIQANLIQANLRGANLREANLRRVNLRGTNLRETNLKNISCDENTKWQGIKGLAEAKNVPEELIKQLTQ